MLDFLSFTLGSFAALFPVADPLGAVPIFLILAKEVSQKDRDKMAWKIAIYVIIVLVTFLFIGRSVLNFFGISIAVVKIAGGIVVFDAGWQTLNEKARLELDEEQEAQDRVSHQKDITFIPMTIPLLAGPGSIAVTLGLAAQAGQGFTVSTIFNLLAVIVAIIVMGIITYLCLRLSTRFLNMLGETGITAISRILGLFILAIGVQLVLNGLADWIIHFQPGEEIGKISNLIKK